MKAKMFRVLSLATGLCLAVSISAGALTLPGDSGYQLDVGSSAPVHSENALPLGGGQLVMNVDDFDDLKDITPAQREAVTWFLTNGVTNGGRDWTTFGAQDPYLRHEMIHFIYRFYSIMDDSGEKWFSDIPMNAAWSDVHFKFADPSHALRWAGIIEGTGNNEFRPYDTVTTEVLLVTLYRAFHSDYTCLSDTAVIPTAGTAADLAGYSDAGQVSDWAVEAVAAMINAGYYTPENGRIEPQKPLTKLEAVEILYRLKGTNAPISMDMDVHTGMRDALTAAATLNEDAVLTGQTFSSTADNGTALAVSDGAAVTLANSRMTTSSALKIPYPLIYRWGVGAGVHVSDHAKLTLKNVTTDISNGSMAGGLYANTGGVIHAVDCTFNSNGQHNSNICYGGTIIEENCTLTGSGRTFSSDFFGGIMVYKNVNSNKTSGGSWFLDENTSFYCVDSVLNGDSTLGMMTGVATAYLENTQVNMGSGLTISNNTSMLSDIVTMRAVDSTFRFSEGGVATVTKEQKAILSFEDCRISAPVSEPMFTVYGNQYGSYSALRVYLDGTDLTGKVFVADGCSLEVYYTSDSDVHLTQDVSESMVIDDMTQAKTKMTVTNTGTFKLIPVNTIR